MTLHGLVEERTLAKEKKNRNDKKQRKRKKNRKPRNDKNDGSSTCQEDGQFCREDWGAYCTEFYVSPDLDQCIAAFGQCCTLYAQCKTESAFDCEDDVAF